MASQNPTAGADVSCRVQTIRLWFKSFIPGDLEGAIPVPAGVHQGKTMFAAPGPVDAWFLTDQRSFSPAPHAHARMHSEIELDLMNYRVVREMHRCDPTIQVDDKTGEEECRETADTSDISFSKVEFIRDAKQVVMHLHGATKNACLKIASIAVSPNLDYELDIVVSLDESEQQAIVQIDGQIERYPAFEMYATINGGPTATILQAPVEPGYTPVSLAGPPQRKAHESVTMHCEAAPQQRGH